MFVENFILAAVSRRPLKFSFQRPISFLRGREGVKPKQPGHAPNFFEISEFGIGRAGISWANVPPGFFICIPPSAQSGAKKGGAQAVLQPPEKCRLGLGPIRVCLEIFEIIQSSVTNFWRTDAALTLHASFIERSEIDRFIH